MLNVGNIAPLNIEVLDQEGRPISLSMILGKPIVIYFYPKDDTPGCTTEACGFRDYNSQLESLGVQVIGVSGDSPESHQKFTQKHKLNFALWSDPGRKLIAAFGALGEKSMFGKKFLGIKRMTFILDDRGVITKVWSKVNTKTHAREILDFFHG